jgi:hypothetical protein
MEDTREPRPDDAREPYQSPVLARHGTLQDLTAGDGQKAHQASTDQQSTPPSF